MIGCFRTPVRKQPVTALYFAAVHLDVEELILLWLLLVVFHECYQMVRSLCGCLMYFISLMNALTLTVMGGTLYVRLGFRSGRSDRSCLVKTEQNR